MTRFYKWKFNFPGYGEIEDGYFDEDGNGFDEYRNYWDVFAHPWETTDKIRIDHDYMEREK